MPEYGPPLLPPPPVIPPKPFNSYIVDCLYSYTYVWLTNGIEFWFYPTAVQYGAVVGYRWVGTFWIFDGIDSRYIDQVTCYHRPIPTPF
jgi:hypothetical protein